MIRFIKDNEGMALIMAVLIISLIVALTLQFNTSMRSNLQAAVNLRDGIKLGCIARSGVNGALAVLHEDAFSGNVDTLREDWVHTKSFSESSSSLFIEGRFVVGITDLSGKIQLSQLVDKDGNYNSTQKSLLIRFMNLPEFGLDSEEVENIVDAIKDWIDKDNETTRFGAEDAYYKALQKPYSCKNAHIEFLKELLFIRGITEELLYGSVEKPGIAQHLSPHGDGKININTADILILQSLSDDIDQERAADMVAYRENEDNDLLDPKWYKNVPGMTDVSIPDSLITTSSTYFKITSEGFKGSMSKKIEAAVERKEESLQVLSWKVV
jgi:general secretion pathway protein K